MWRSFIARSLLLVLSAYALSGCATAQMHTQEQLNTVGRTCGLALGELIQDESEKKLLLLIRHEVSAEQRTCVIRWARRNHLKPVFVNMNFES